MQAERVRVEWVAVVASVASLLATSGGWIWWGGRLSQRVDTIEAQIQQVTVETEKLRIVSGSQGQSIAATNAQFSMISSQLNRLEAKMDTLR